MERNGAPPASTSHIDSTFLHAIALINGYALLTPIGVSMLSPHPYSVILLTNGYTRIDT